MPFRRTSSKGTSEQNVALVRMQIAAQARNRRWHEFLCAKRDELQTRLRQQGFSQQGIGAESAALGDDPGSALAGAAPTSPSAGWRAPRTEVAADTDADAEAEAEPSQEVDAQAAEALDWWADESRG